MIHIILFILKIIGIILLSVLAVAILVLLFPITYKGQLQYNEDKGNGKITAGWLFHLVHFSGRYDGEEFGYKLRVFGIPVISSDKDEEAEKKETGEKKPKDKKTKYKKDEDRKFEARNFETYSTKENFTDINEEQILEKNQILNKTDYMDFEDEHARKIKEKANKRNTDKRKFTGRIKELFNNIRNKIKNITHNIKNSKNKADEVKKVLHSETTKRAWKHGKKLIVKVLKHISPRKVQGRIYFGFEEPHITGEVLGMIAMIFGILGINLKHFVVEPDFENKVIDAKLKIKGHIFAGVVGIYALRFYFNKEIHYMIKKYNR